MHNQLLINVSRNLQRFGWAVAIMASTLASQSEAQVSFNLNDIDTTPTLASEPAASRVLVSPTTAPTVDKIHRYSLDKAGNLNGQITVTGDRPSDLNVFAMQGKQVVHQATTNTLGEFSLAGINPGQYSIVIAGRNQLGAQGIMIDRNGSQEANDFFELSTIKTSYQGIQDLVATALPQEISTKLGKAERDIKQVSATFSDIEIPKQVRIINGNIRGQVVSLLDENSTAGTKIHLLQNSKPVAQVEIDGEGFFTIPDAESGVYDLVATADSGFAAMRIEAVAKETPMKMVSFSQQVPVELSVPLAEDCPCNQAPVQAIDQPIEYNNDQVVMEASSQSPVEYAGESIGCGGACGGCGGSCGNFSNVSSRVLGARGGAGGFIGGNTGGLSRLLTLGSLAAAVVAIADDDSEPASNEEN